MPIILKSEVVDQVQSRRDIKILIAEEYGLSPTMGVRTVNRWLRQNRGNSPLTTKAALRIIAKHLFISEKNLTDETIDPKRNGSPVTLDAG